MHKILPQSCKKLVSPSLKHVLIDDLLTLNQILVLLVEKTLELDTF